MRDLSLRLMTAYYHRGKILLEAQELGVLCQLMREERVSRDEVHACIALYQQWAAFLRAEEWNLGLFRDVPQNPMDALHLIDRWVAAGSPRPLDVRGFIDSLMVIMSVPLLPVGDIVTLVCQA